MTRSKRPVPLGVVFSVVGHGGLLLALLIAGRGGVRSVPPPEPITVEIVRSDEVRQPETPHVEGTPLDSTSNGSEMSSDSKNGSANTGPSRPKIEALPQQSQAPVNPQGGGEPAAAQPQAAPPPAEEGEAPPQPTQALVLPTKSMVQPPDETQSQPNPGEMFAMPLALPGGRISSGLDAAASNPAMLPHDDTAAFRARLGSCSKLPDWIGRDDNAAILLRVSFKRDGTLASPPEVLRSSLTADAVALTSAAVGALQRCQPFTELPADKYKDWKTLDLVVTPLSLSGR
jgi:hypothetical protein